jgi:hypothetical protein
MIQLDGKDLDILIYPMDLLIAGKPRLVARARAAMASRLTTTAAHLTISAEAQAIEDRLTGLIRRPADQPDARPRYDERVEATLTSIDEELASVDIQYEEWEVLYRQRLQVERDLRAGAMAEETVLGADAVPEGGPAAALDRVGRWLRAGAGAIIEAAGDERTVEALDKAAGPEWRWAARAASVAAGAAREVLREDEARDVEAGEPLAVEEPESVRRP